MKVSHLSTLDGSSTLFSEEHQDTFHSRNGAWQESEHIFIKSGLLFLKNKSSLRILEMGFGTGLNVLLTFIHGRDVDIELTTIEKNPLDGEIVSHLSFPQMNTNDRDVFQCIHDSPWNQKVQISEKFVLIKEHVALEDFRSDKKFDLIYFDAFSPKVQPELWSLEVFQYLKQICSSGAVLVTYSSSGFVRRNLEMAGFSVEKIPGPQGKREIIRAFSG